jgi:hypothetical protein
MRRALMQSFQLTVAGGADQDVLARSEEGRLALVQVAQGDQFAHAQMVDHPPLTARLMLAGIHVTTCSSPSQTRSRW